MNNHLDVPGRGGGRIEDAIQASPSQYSKKNIEAQRDYDKKYDKLRKEFVEIDMNGDGKVTPNELVDFLNNKVVYKVLTNVNRGKERESVNS
jgi:Ca2+-binding EF-hand superfamily protein